MNIWLHISLKDGGLKRIFSLPYEPYNDSTGILQVTSLSLIESQQPNEDKLKKKHVRKLKGGWGGVVFML